MTASGHQVTPPNKQSCFLRLRWGCRHFEWLTSAGRAGARTGREEPRHKVWLTQLSENMPESARKLHYSSKREKYSIAKCQLIINRLLGLSSLLLGRAIPNNIQTSLPAWSFWTLLIISVEHKKADKGLCVHEASAWLFQLRCYTLYLISAEQNHLL